MSKSACWMRCGLVSSWSSGWKIDERTGWHAEFQAHPELRRHRLQRLADAARLPHRAGDARDGHRRPDRRGARPRQRQRPDRCRRPRRRPGRQLLQRHAQLPAEVFVRAVNAHLPDDVVDPRRRGSAAGVRRQPRRRCGSCTATSSTTARCPTRSCAATAATAATRSTRRRWPGRPSRSAAGTTSTASRPSGRTACRACGRSRTSAVNRVGEYIWIDVEADGFLYNMVRAIAGTLINVGRGYWPESSRSPRSCTPRTATRPGRRRRRRGCS